VPKGTAPPWAREEGRLREFWIVDAGLWPAATTTVHEGGM
jgi:hypothetical protein